MIGFKNPAGGSHNNRELACLRSILILAAKDGIIEKVPCIKLLEEKNTRLDETLLKRYENRRGKARPY